MALDSASPPSGPGTQEPPLEEFERLHPYRSRGLSSLERILGDVSDHIRARLADGTPLRVLEIGCGYGRTLVDLRVAFGERLELHGLNRHPRHGTWATARRSVAKDGRLSDEAFERLEPPTLHYADVADRLPFADDRFDLVVSQVSFVYFRRKAEIIEEIDRILAPGGVARIDVNIDFPDNPVEYARSIEIWDGGRQVPFWEYVARFDGLLKSRERPRPYLEIRKTPGLRLGLTYVDCVELGAIHTAWWGTKSIYRVAPPAR